MIRWFHRLLHPHCPDCVREAELGLVCKSCNVLSVLLEQERHTNEKLLEQVINLTKPVVVSEPVKEIEKLELPKQVPWRVKQQFLEAEDRAKARILKEQEIGQNKIERERQQIEEMEKELGIENKDAS